MVICIYKPTAIGRPFVHAPRQLQKIPDVYPPRVKFQLFLESSTLLRCKTSSVIRESTYIHLSALVDEGTYFRNGPLGMEHECFTIELRAT